MFLHLSLLFRQNVQLFSENESIHDLGGHERFLRLVLGDRPANFHQGRQVPVEQVARWNFIDAPLVDVDAVLQLVGDVPAVVDHPVDQLDAGQRVPRRYVALTELQIVVE